MCGRTCCCLRPERYECATCFYDTKTEEYKKPRFQESKNLEFKPSTNIAPTEVTPVLLWDAKESSKVLKPMIWGLIPSWADSSYSSSKYHTHNCRIESVKESKIYKPQLEQGRRCVVICEGYYEWRTIDTKNKVPAFIYSQQPKGERVEEISSWGDATWSSKKGWNGPVLTYMAGLYSFWESPLKGVVGSYTVITMPSSSAVSWLHHRMPAILSSPEEIEDWLNCEDIDGPEAISNLHQSKAVSYHFVSSAVNNSHYKGSDCNKPADEKKTGIQRKLTSWFMKTPAKRASSVDDGNDNSNKKMKF